MYFDPTKYCVIFATGAQTLRFGDTVFEERIFTHAMGRTKSANPYTLKKRLKWEIKPRWMRSPPPQTMVILSDIGTKKAKQRLDKMFIQCVAGSFLLGFGCAMNVSTNASPWFQENAPDLIKAIAACFFPVGLIMCFLIGADLLTSYCMVSLGKWCLGLLGLTSG